MKWKRSKKAQQEARAKSSGGDKHRHRGDNINNDSSKNNNNGFDGNKTNNSEMDDDDCDLGDDDLDQDEDIEDEEEEIDVGDGEHKDISHLLPHLNPQMSLGSSPSSGGPPPLHLLREALPSMEHHGNTNLNSILPPHLARMGSGPNSRFYRPFVA
jgi:hypothetical protein